MAAVEMTEAQAVNLVRNALVVAGEEMGKDGDHWPVIKATVHSIMQDWESVQIERNVDAEMKIHLYAQLEDMERRLVDCPAETKASVAPKLKTLREIYDAYFSPAAASPPDIGSDDMPMHVKRAQTIIDTLEAEHE